MKVILKNDGIFIFEDFQLNRIAKRLREVQIDKVFPIRRKDDGDIKAYMVSETWYQSKILAGEPASIWEDVSDDKMAVNILTYTNIINSKVEVASQQHRVNVEGPNGGEFKGYRVYNTNEFIIDTNFTLPQDGIVVGGTILARYISPSHYALIA